MASKLSESRLQMHLLQRHAMLPGLARLAVLALAFDRLAPAECKPTRVATSDEFYDATSSGAEIIEVTDHFILETVATDSNCSGRGCDWQFNTTVRAIVVCLPPWSNSACNSGVPPSIER
jgi:hypothetical protein